MEKLGITIFAYPPKLKELLNACRLIASQTLEENGCVDCRVFTASGEDSTVRLEQHWRHRDLLEDYFRTDHFGALLGAMKLLAIDWEMAINGGTPENAMIVVRNARGP